MILRRWLAARRLARSLKPDPTYMQRRLSQLSPERRERQIAATQALRASMPGRNWRTEL